MASSQTFSPAPSSVWPLGVRMLPALLTLGANISTWPPWPVICAPAATFTSPGGLPGSKAGPMSANCTFESAGICLEFSPKVGIPTPTSRPLQ
ncbi:hypothetical protein D9M69_654480 [compost metagenome]